MTSPPPTLLWCLLLFFSHEHIEIVVTKDGEPAFFRQREGPFFPSLRILHRCMISCIFLAFYRCMCYCICCLRFVRKSIFKFFHYVVLISCCKCIIMLWMVVCLLSPMILMDSEIKSIYLLISCNLSSMYEIILLVCMSVCYLPLCSISQKVLVGFEWNMFC